eukprot:2457436-Pleurochrysis_carterae.AAC.2
MSEAGKKRDQLITSLGCIDPAWNCHFKCSRNQTMVVSYFSQAVWRIKLSLVAAAPQRLPSATEGRAERCALTS